MSLFESRPPAVVVIDERLARVQLAKSAARSQLAGALADLARLESEEDSLLALRTAEAGRP